MNIKKWVTVTSILTSAIFSHLALANTLSVTKITTNKGNVSDQGVSVLDNLEQSGQQDNWNTYLEMAPNSKKFVGIFHFNQPIDDDWQQMIVNVNTLGESSDTQRWKFQLRDFSRNKWVTIGDNNEADAWIWHHQTFSIDQDIQNFINSSGNIKLRYLSNNAVDISNVDLATIELVTDEVVEPPPPPPPPSEGDWWQPSPDENITWQWQINGTLDTSLNVDMYDIDLFDTSTEQIAALKASNRIVVCYFSAGTYEGWREDWQTFFPFIEGDAYSGSQAPFAGNMADWDERWLDISRIDLLEDIMRSRMQLAVAKGCDAVEPDNMDAYSNSAETGIALTAQDQLNYNRFIAELAHEYGLSVGLKNDVEQLPELVDYFDWALNEQCFQYNECNGYDVFVNAGKAVFGVEYSGDASQFCAQAHSQNLNWLKKKLSLNAWRLGCEDYD
ncbi:endo alpha-1,4 polygalactosaminidase [uncultured Paraglaciecola sp.]|mgnify:CR=1 FL=1|uniref:endo alpha-1,4 polygalactosaminidase n=1 Tax=uncultured Paraglaciecola sp. TaxID=1765024 RepID=UPI002613AD40|nr:endo alpha-1,4 polygalactosaminidase [uncultured Paraglaciecola sp.]